MNRRTDSSSLSILTTLSPASISHFSWSNSLQVEVQMDPTLVINTTLDPGSEDKGWISALALDNEMKYSSHSKCGDDSINPKSDLLASPKGPEDTN
ncbi:hypothetical protein EJ110_NYTH29691 [Nymphaea thermarum]|nr:hypothetical protein EJ110_NYTH29691 [Nymphaea thermarum]